MHNWSLAVGGDWLHYKKAKNSQLLVLNMQVMLEQAHTRQRQTALCRDTLGCIHTLTHTLRKQSSEDVQQEEMQMHPFVYTAHVSHCIVFMNLIVQC